MKMVKDFFFKVKPDIYSLWMNVPITKFYTQIGQIKESGIQILFNLTKLNF